MAHYACTSERVWQMSELRSLRVCYIYNFVYDFMQLIDRNLNVSGARAHACVSKFARFMSMPNNKYEIEHSLVRNVGHVVVVVVVPCKL